VEALSVNFLQQEAACEPSENLKQGFMNQTALNWVHYAFTQD
jgi:hypothetical protein